jgi:hypothetical protein
MHGNDIMASFSSPHGSGLNGGCGGRGLLSEPVAAADAVFQPGIGVPPQMASQVMEDQLVPTLRVKEVFSVKQRLTTTERRSDLRDGLDSDCGLSDRASHVGYGSLVPAESGDLAKQHYEWAQELETVDQKQADLMTLQWKLVRNQTGMLAQQLVDVRKQMDDWQREQRQMAVRIDKSERDSESFEQRLKSFVRQLFEKLEDGISRVKQELDHEVQRRDAEELNFQRRLDELGDELAKASNRSGLLEQDAFSAKSELAAQKALLPELRKHVQNALDEIRGSSDQLHRKITEDLDIERRERERAHADFLDKDRKDREMHYSKINSYFANSQVDLGNLRDEHKTLGGRLQEVENKVHNMLKEQIDCLELKIHEPMSLVQQMDRRVEHIVASIQQESLARQSLAEVFEQMLKTERTKLTNLVTQKATFSRLDCEELQKTVQESLERNRLERDATLENLVAAQNRQHANVEERLGDMDTHWKNMDHRCQMVMAESRDTETRYRKLFDEQVGSALRDVRREAQDWLGQERAAREAKEKQFADHLEFIGEQHERLRDVFVHKGPRRSLKSASRALPDGADNEIW